jgi:hypothetical protein
MALAFRSPGYEEGRPSRLEFKSPSVDILVEHLERREKPHILDLGAPRSENVAFFSRIPCKLYVEDLHRVLDVGPPSGEEAEDPADIVARALAYDTRVRFDLVLGWDVFNYLTPPLIEALAGCVARSCRNGALLFLTGSTGEAIPDTPASYCITPSGALRYEVPGGAAAIANPRHSPVALERMMPGFRLLHSFLLGEGVQEYLFRFS